MSVENGTSVLMQDKDNDVLNTNIFSDATYKKVTKETLDVLENTLKKSLGYYGSSTVIEDRTMNHIITKDGYTILKYINFRNPIAITIYEIVMKISRNLVETVGDGSTSSVIIANKLYKELEESNLLSNYPSKIIIETLNEIERVINKYIDKVAVPITDGNFDVIKKIATVANNNDDKIGEMIYEIYKHIKTDGFIYLENSPDEEDHYEFIDGIEFNRGLIASEFKTEKYKEEANFKEPFIFMCNERLTSEDLNFMVDQIGAVVAQHMKPVVIIAKSFSVEFVNCWIINKKNNPNMQIALVDFSFANNNSKEIFEDIATYTGSKIYDPNTVSVNAKTNFLTFLGKCDRMSITMGTTKIMGKNCTNEAMEERIKFIDETIQYYKDRASIEGRNFDKEIFQMESRKANLKSKNVKFFVGGNSEIEKENRKYLVEDSIFACRSALESGYVSGGNLTIPKIVDTMLYNEDSDAYKEIHENMTDIKSSLLHLISTSFIMCYREVLNNASITGQLQDNIIKKCVEEHKIYNIRTNEYEDDSTSSIINSSKTESEIMKSTFSIIGLLITSNQFISQRVY